MSCDVSAGAIWAWYAVCKVELGLFTDGVTDALSSLINSVTAAKALMGAAGGFAAVTLLIKEESASVTPSVNSPNSTLQTAYQAQMAPALTSHDTTLYVDVSTPVGGPKNGVNAFRHWLEQTAGVFECAWHVATQLCRYSCLFTVGLTSRGGKATAVAAQAAPIVAVNMTIRLLMCASPCR